MTVYTSALVPLRDPQLALKTEQADRRAARAASLDRVQKLASSGRVWRADEWTSRYAAALAATGKLEPVTW